MKKIAIVFALTVGLHQNAFAINESFKQYHQGNYQEAKKGLQDLVQQKNKEALFYYGLMTLQGYSVKQNTEEALSLIKQSALKDNIKAQLFLAKYSMTMTNDANRAFYWFKKAADKGDKTAQLFISGAYKEGFGVKENKSLYLSYLIKAANNGSKIAQYYLGKEFVNKHTQRSEKLGIAWLKKSAKKNYSPALYELVKTYENNKEKRKYWLDKLKMQHTAQSEYYVGKHYLSFNDKAIKLSSLKWLNSSAKQGNNEAIYTLGLLHQSPDPTFFNDKKAFNETLKAAMQGYLPAQIQLSNMYEKGIGTKIDLKESLAWLNKSPQSLYPQQKNKLLNWVSNSNRALNQSALYQYKGILNEWTNKANNSNGALNKSPKMLPLKKETVFKPTLTFASPLEIDAYLLADTLNIKKAHYFKTLPTYVLKSNSVNSAQLKETYSRALLGNREAQFLLGQYHEFGTGVDKNLNAAAQWYFSSAKQNYLPAEYNLGLAFLYGDGVKQNLDKASYWLNRTAFKGNIKAQYALGIIYQYGFTSKDLLQQIPLDERQSTLMYHLASGAGDPRAKYQLATYYSEQKLNQMSSSYQKNKKHQQVLALYEQAFNQGIDEAKLPLAFYYLKKGISTEKQQWAFSVLKNKAEKASPQLSLLLALMYERGIGTAKNMEAAIQWYKIAANNNLAAAQYVLGSYYFLGKHLNLNKLKAETLLQNSARQGLSFAYYNLAVLKADKKDDPTPYLHVAAEQGNIKAMLYLADKALLKSGSLEHAALLYKTLANKGNTTAEVKLGFMYQNGLHFKKDTKKAQHYYLKAAKKNNAMALFELGYLEQTGHNGSPDINKAIRWYEKSANKNFSPAMLALGFLYETSKGNYSKAQDWYEKAAINQNPLAHYNQALIFEYGKGIKYNEQEAKNHYLKVSNR